MIESVKVKDMAKSAQIMKETLIEEVQRFYADWEVRLDVLNFKHEEERDYYYGKLNMFLHRT